MPQGLSQTTLPALKVHAAAQFAVAAIKVKRAEIQANVEAAWFADCARRRPWRTWWAGYAQTVEELPSGLKMWLLHRADDEATLNALAGLCSAALDVGENFTVEVTADDFRLLAPFYTRTK